MVIYHRDYDREQFADNQIPLLVIGTKLDQIHETKRHEVLIRTAFLAEDFNAEEINLVCTFTNVCLGYVLGKAALYSNPQLTNPEQIRVSLSRLSHEGLFHFELVHWAVGILKLYSANSTNHSLFFEKT